MRAGKKKLVLVIRENGLCELWLRNDYERREALPQGQPGALAGNLQPNEMRWLMDGIRIAIRFLEVRIDADG